MIFTELNERKARAFASWADVSGDGSLRHEAKRAEKAAQTTREMQANRGGQTVGGTAGSNRLAVKRLLTRQQGVHARAVLDYVAAHSPHPEAEVRLTVLMLTLQAARAGTGNVTGRDLTDWLRDDAEGEMSSGVMGENWASRAIRQAPAGSLTSTSARHAPSGPRTSSSACAPVSRAAAATSSFSRWCASVSRASTHSGAPGA
ncbi:hypothetical protein [Streptomyces rapamycinicus]|uniref:Uncharacterized protein n=2 Tax=Streptomyces rapamycinicus TaxID=1226757 RepID=A0A0A0NXG7_STRRN|nr:hypothetical protein [Streptomyces rapamycinicus]AGP61500.1 hypothetical protein M271_50725 [Streptomyces rapamycinicus NRRL 5491]MBB4787301.1 hypothetical protein [Streptomyces rapamycinicus]RLV71649.1 hypothetical protein D3C57_144020 [Streptomyces rapamycinicus NRRL 5491]UTP36950.1 hypothetical protein LIV37_51795 [Streptomyces rapamycinicus NRRL 5491]